MKNGEVISGAEILREGLMLDEREHSVLPEGMWAAVRARLERDRQVREDERPVRASAMRQFLYESDDDVRAVDPVAEADLGLESTLVAFRRRHGLPADTVLTPRLVAEVVAARERGREQRALQADPFES